MEKRPTTKICHVTSVHERTDVRIRKFCRTLVEANYKVVLLCVDAKGEELVDGLHIQSISFYPKNKLQRILRSAHYMFKEALQIDADIYHIHDPELLPLALRLKRMGKKVIYDSHEDFPQQIKRKTFVIKPFKKLSSFIVTKYLNYATRKFDATISVTPHIVAKLAKSGAPVYLITNYPLIEKDESSFSEEEYLLRENTLCYAGTIYEFSNQKEILEALDSLHCSIIYKLVGYCSDAYTDELSKYPYWNKVDFIPTVPKSELLKIYQSATIAIVVSDYLPDVGNNIGTLGCNKIFEYMLVGLPIICTDFILWKEFVDHYHCGICVPPSDVNAIKEAIKYLIEHKAEAYQMGQNGRRAVMEEFNWGTQAISYLSIIDKIHNSK